MKYQPNYHHMLILLFAFLLPACSQHDSLLNPAKDLSGSRTSLYVNESVLLELIERTAFDPMKSWHDLDDLYRNQIVQTGSRDLKNNTYIYMVRSKRFIETADIKTLQYYADQLEQTDFNISLNTIVPLIHKMQPTWGKFKTKRYARAMVEKNSTYWHTHFTGKTSYLTLNATALEELKDFYSRP